MTYSIYTHRCNLTDKFLIEHDRAEKGGMVVVFKDGGAVYIDKVSSAVKVYVPFQKASYVTLDGITKDNFLIACHIARDTENWKW